MLGSLKKSVTDQPLFIDNQEKLRGKTTSQQKVLFYPTNNLLD